jgi:hypothetical protein
MRALRVLHAVTVLLAGIAFAVALFGFVRLPIAALALALCLHVWSLETLRTSTVQREPRP